ncbi:MAG TPA: hypothetical protein VHC70_07455 [Phycisphaerales bacterium]|nr:hypothetical protein [Phycisphaerales bacterium]
MENASVGVQGFCRSCDYPLGAVVGNRCPECGREFDPSDARTFEKRPRQARRRRLMVRIAIPVGALLALVVLFPRGYVVGTIGFSCACGETLTATRKQLIGPSWLPIAYPHWTTVPQASTLHLHTWMFTVSATKTMFRWNLGTRPAGMVTAMGTSGARGPGTVNGQIATPENAGAVLANVVGQMARTGAFGVRVGSAGMGSAGGAMPMNPAATERSRDSN